MLNFKSLFTEFRAASGCRFVATTAISIGLACFASAASGQEPQTVNNPKAHATLNFSIVIPEVLRILENSHPPLLQATMDTPASPITALQRIVVLSTLRKGFCMDMSLTQAHIADWSLSISGSTGSWLQQTAGGYRLCLGRAGRYELALEHKFRLKADSPTPANPASDLYWPVNVSVATP